MRTAATSSTRSPFAAPRRSAVPPRLAPTPARVRAQSFRQGGNTMNGISIAAAPAADGPRARARRAVRSRRRRLRRDEPGDPDVHAALRAPDHEPRRPAPADPELLRRPARHRRRSAPTATTPRRRAVGRREAGGWLAAQSHGGHGHGQTQKAIVLDVDDTTLATWNYEIASNWAYNPTTNAQYVNGQLFPPVPGMVDLVNQAADEGYAIFFLTGRPPRRRPRRSAT